MQIFAKLTCSELAGCQKTAGSLTEVSKDVQSAVQSAAGEGSKQPLCPNGWNFRNLTATGRLLCRQGLGVLEGAEAKHALGRTHRSSSCK